MQRTSGAQFWLQGPLFCDCYSPYDDISDGMFHDRHSYEKVFRVYPNNFGRRISKNYLVRRVMACRERRTRPLALPRQPKASAVSLPPICEFQLGDNSRIAPTSSLLLIELYPWML